MGIMGVASLILFIDITCDHLTRFEIPFGLIQNMLLGEMNFQM